MTESRRPPLTCLYRTQSLPAPARDCIARCLGCGSESHACGNSRYCDSIMINPVAGLCPACLDRAERLALEAAGQGRQPTKNGATWSKRRSPYARCFAIGPRPRSPPSPAEHA
jgi:hypothetical protein